MKSKILSLIILVVILSSSCKRKDPCEDSPPDYYFHLKIGDSTLSKVPHTGLDTLVFYNQHDDTVFLIGTGAPTYTDYNRGQSSPCGYSEHRDFDYKILYYKQDPALSSTLRVFPLKSIEINADSNDNYSGRSNRYGGYIVLAP